MEIEVAYFVLVYIGYFKSFMLKVIVDKLDLDCVTSFFTISVIKLFFHSSMATRKNKLECLVHAIPVSHMQVRQGGYTKSGTNCSRVGSSLTWKY